MAATIFAAFSVKQKIKSDMDDDRIRNSFNDFEPELSPDHAFIDRLQQNLNAVEAVRRQTEELNKRNKAAVAIAALVGFIAGILFSSALPYLSQAIADLRLSSFQCGILDHIAAYRLTISWIITGAVSVVTAMNAYEISLSVMRHRLRVNGSHH